MRNFFFFWISACLLAASLNLAEAIKGKVVSCPAWTLNKHKELRKFLKGDKDSPAEIDEYANIEVEWIRGKRAVLTIFDDKDNELEQIAMYGLQTRDEMHALLLDKGFAKKSTSQKVADIQLAQMAKTLDLSPLSLASSTGSTQIMLFSVIFGESYCCLGKRRLALESWMCWKAGDPTHQWHVNLKLCFFLFALYRKVSFTLCLQRDEGANPDVDLIHHRLTFEAPADILRMSARRFFLERLSVFLLVGMTMLTLECTNFGAFTTRASEHDTSSRGFF